MALRFCAVTKSAPQTTVDISVGDNALSFDTVMNDTDGFYSAGSPTRLTVPASVNGQYGIITGCLSTTLVNTGISGYALFYVNGAILGIGNAGVSTGTNGNGQSTASSWMQIISMPVLLNTNDFYEFRANIGDGSITINTESNFGIYVDDNQSITQRCLAALSGNLTTQNFTTPTALPFAGTDVYDTDNIHDPSSSNTKLIIPASLNGKYGVVYGSINSTLVAAQTVQSVAIRKTPSGGAASLTYNGFGGQSAVSVNDFSDAALIVQTNVIQFLTGDAYELLVYNNDTSITVNNNAMTALGLWVYGSFGRSNSFGTIIR